MGNSWPEAWPKVEFEDEAYTFDPDGDILLKLRKTIFEAPTTPASDDGSIDPASAEEEVESVLFSKEEPSQNFPIDEEVSGPQGSPGTDQKPAPNHPTIYLRVSSKHLTLASTMFGSMLNSDNFAEGRTLHSKGNLVVELSDDPDALVILMHIVHGMTRKVPRKMSLNALADVAHLVNYYQLHEAAELFSDTWVACLRETLRFESYEPKVVLRWLFISWVFQKGDSFQEMTRTVMCETDHRLQDEIDEEQIPIPASIIQRIQDRRIDEIARIIAEVHDNHIARYLTSDTYCGSREFSCDANTLGSLIKSSAIIGIWPRPKVPYHGMTFQSLASQVRGMQVMDNCIHKACSHFVKNTIETSMRSFEDQFCGLKLKSFSTRRAERYAG